MRRGYLLSKWRRKAETLHRKAVDLAEEIEAAEGDDFSDLVSHAHQVSTSAQQLCGDLGTF